MAKRTLRYTKKGKAAGARPIRANRPKFRNIGSRRKPKWQAL